MNSFNLRTTTCSATAAPGPILVLAQCRTDRPSRPDRAADRTALGRIAAVARSLATWSPMSVSATPSAQATSNLSQADRLGERH